MTTEEFARKVEAVIKDARDVGVSDDEIISELEGILESMREPP